MKHLNIFRRPPDRGGYSDMNTMPCGLSNVPSGSYDEVVVDTNNYYPTEEKVTMDPVEPAHSHLQLIIPSQHSKPTLSIMPGKKYQSINGPHSPGKTLGHTTIGSRTNSTATMNTQSMTASSPDTSLNPFMQRRLSMSNSEEYVKALPHIEESPLEKESGFTDHGHTNQRHDKHTPRAMHQTSDGFHPKTLEKIHGEKIEVVPETATSTQGTNNMNDESNAVPSFINDDKGLLGNRMIVEDETLDEEFSSCYEDEDLNISLHPILLTVSSDITEKSYDDIPHKIFDLPTYNTRYGLDSIWWDVMTKVSSCFVDDPSKLNSQVEHHLTDDVSEKLSTRNPLALCGF